MLERASPAEEGAGAADVKTVEDAMFYMIGTFNFDSTRYTPEKAERHYLEYHVPLAKRMPGLRKYVIGTLLETPRIRPDRHRGAILAFDDLAAWRAAYASPVGRELRADEDTLIAQPRVVLIGGEEVV
jgi:uncharacterized protein (TIGR02118 family)